MKEIVGKCFICKKKISRHDISYIEKDKEYPAACYYAKWPGDGVACTSHAGIIDQYVQELKKADIRCKIQEKRKENKSAD